MEDNTKAGFFALRRVAQTTRWWFVGVFLLKSTQKPFPGGLQHRNAHKKTPARERAGARSAIAQRTALRLSTARPAPPPHPWFVFVSPLHWGDLPFGRVVEFFDERGLLMARVDNRRSARAPCGCRQDMDDTIDLGRRHLHRIDTLDELTGAVEAGRQAADNSRRQLRLRVRARKYLKSMGATQFGEPAVLRDRLGALFTANRIRVHVPGTTRIEIKS